MADSTLAQQIAQKLELELIQLEKDKEAQINTLAASNTYPGTLAPPPTFAKEDYKRMLDAYSVSSQRLNPITELARRVTETEDFFRYAMATSPEFNRIHTAWKAARRLGGK